ncbi:MAG TPA: metallophosphoesterase [Solirubrobacteraceae bacterium]|nr:metallophosphoesterase [Solirubrobacteraceae bacterium]
MRRLLAIAAVLVLAGAAGAIYLWSPWRSEPAIRAPSGPYVPSGPDDRALLWAVGDGADGGMAARSVVARMKRKRFDRVLYLGDVYGSGLLSLLTGDGTAADYRERYDPLYGEFAQKTAPTIGNHEWRQRGEGYEPYWEKVFGRPPPAYYAFAVAGWQLLSLNSEAPHGAGSAQVRWLREQLRAPGTCRLAFWHAPRWTAGRHTDDPSVAPLWDALRGHATIVVAGHDHNMQRFKPIDGLTQYVSGAGGRKRYALRRDGRLAFGNDHDFGALRIELSPGRARTAFVSAEGRILDVHRLRCTRQQAHEPAASRGR